MCLQPGRQTASSQAVGLIQMAKMWDADTGKEKFLPSKGTPDAGALSVAFSPDGKRIVTGGGRHDKPGEVKVWDADTGTEKFALKGHTNEVHSVCFSPDGKWIVTGSSDWTARVWDAATGTEKLALKGHPVTSVCFSPDGKHIVTGSSDRTARVWDVNLGTEK